MSCPVLCASGSISGGSHRVRVRGTLCGTSVAVGVGHAEKVVGVSPTVGLGEGGTPVGLVKREQPTTECIANATMRIAMIALTRGGGFSIYLFLAGILASDVLEWPFTASSSTLHNYSTTPGF
jgi:hypothetical protein